jgi:hypothetical protein
MPITDKTFPEFLMRASYNTRRVTATCNPSSSRVSELSPEIDPEWDIELSISTSPTVIIDAVFYTADSVHAGAETCIDADLILFELVANDERSENYCRLVEQRYTEDEGDEVTWQDWAVELRIQGTFVTGHWRVQLPGSPSDWEWSGKEAEKAFSAASLLMGRRVRKAIAVEESTYAPPPSLTRH